MHSTVETNRISHFTRQAIFDDICGKRICWYGGLGEEEFLSSIYNLEALPSNDPRCPNAKYDRRLHRDQFNDWEEDWIFNDPRFKLMYGSDNIFLKFLSRMLHPSVRSDKNEVIRIHKILNEHLADDNFELFEVSRISSRPIFEGRPKDLGSSIIHNHLEEIQNLLSQDYVLGQIKLMQNSVDTNPIIAIGTAKELIETICKSILLEKGIPIDEKLELPKLYKKTAEQLQLTPNGVKDEKKASDTIKSILDSFTTIVQGLAELRNKYGNGHGKEAGFKGLQPRHAKLSVGAASTLAIFLLETHKYRP